MKEIICYSKKYGNQIALVDDTDFEEINKYGNLMSGKFADGGNMNDCYCYEIGGL